MKSQEQSQLSTLNPPLVSPGYKQTEVGVIPEDWQILSLKQLTLDMLQGVNTAIDKPEYVLDGIPMLKANNIIDGEVIFEGADQISYRTFFNYSDRFKAKKYDFLFSNIGARLGTGSLLKRDIDCSFAWNVMRIVPDTRRIEPEYLAFLINSPKYSQEIKSYQSGSGMGFVPKSVMQGLVVACPNNLEEQHAIATALSDVDALLDGLNRLIAKKRDLKQAAMQQLLTGETRLPGFEGEWGETTLGKIGECIIGLTYKPENIVEHGLLVLRSSNVQNGRLAFENNVYVNLEVAEHLYTRSGDILVCVRNGSRALIGKCAVIDDAAVGLTFGAFMSVFRTKHWRFIVHAFQSDDIQRQIRDNIGATINQITNKDMKAFRVKLPPEDEQTAIATVLSDMDAEIAALEQRRNKTKDIKQAMMQELLTGKTRLI